MSTACVRLEEAGAAVVAIAVVLLVAAVVVIASLLLLACALPSECMSDRTLSEITSGACQPCCTQIAQQ
jgi:hypothetical protein